MSQGSTLWVKKDVHPEFARQIPQPAKSQVKNTKSKKTKNQKPDPKGDKKDKKKKDARPEPMEAKSPLDLNGLLSDWLNVDAIPLEIGLWIRDAVGGDRYFARELTDVLIEMGVLSIGEQVIDGKKVKAAVLSDPQFSDQLEASMQASMESLASSPLDPVFKVASAVMPLFKEKVIEEIKKKREPFPSEPISL
jgi:hypothetical protein